MSAYTFLYGSNSAERVAYQGLELTGFMVCMLFLAELEQDKFPRVPTSALSHVVVLQLHCTADYTCSVLCKFLSASICQTTDPVLFIV
jgi:hypothetical protein